MTRRALCKRLAVCLVLGAVTTVAVAWGFALRGPNSRSKPTQVAYGPIKSEGGKSITPNERIWNGGRIRTLPAAAMSTTPGYRSKYVQDRPFESFSHGWGLDYDAFRARADRPDTVWVIEHAYGWPMPALWFVSEQLKSKTAHIGGIKLPKRWIGNRGKYNAFETRALPWRPVWAGFGLNTLFFGSIFAPLVFGSSIWRERRRRGCGRCPKCSYDLLGDLDAGCPECGWGKD